MSRSGVLSGAKFKMSSGALALAILARDRLRQRLQLSSQRVGTPRATELAERTATQFFSTVPYGVAIATAGVVTLVLSTSLVR